MTFAIDCRMIDSSGIGVYLKGILPHIFKSRNKFLLIGEPTRLNCYLQNQNTEIIDCDVKPFSFKETFKFPIDIIEQINRADIYFTPFFNIPQNVKIPVFITMHDIIFADMPELTGKIGLYARMWFFKRAHKISKKIFTVSEYSKSRIIHHLGNSRPVTVTYSALQDIYLEFNLKNKLIEKKQTIVFIGNIKKHKGLHCLIEAFLMAKNEGLPYKLIIIGSRENFRTGDNAILDKIDSMGNESIVFTGFLSNEEILEHLSQSSLLVQPSYYEGFGLPPLEAMTVGTNVLISDIPVFREIYENYPVEYFKAGDIIDLKNKLLDILRGKPPVNVVLNEQQLNKYCFQKTAGIIIKELF